MTDFTGEPGDQTYIGKSGINTLDYSLAPDLVDVNLATNTAQDGFGGTDTIGNIQVVIGSTHGGSFAGGSGKVTFVINGGDNTITGTPPTITEFLIPTPDATPFSMEVGPDGNIWFTEWQNNKIGFITIAGAITEFDAPGLPGDIAFDAAGNLWYVEIDGNNIVRITTGGVNTSFPVPTANAFVHRIIAGPDGAMWFAESGTDKIGRIALDGTITEFTVPTPLSQPFDLTIGPDGAIWFTEFTGNKIGRLDPTTGNITEFDVPIAPPPPNNPVPHIGAAVFITTGPDGALWYSNFNAGKIGRMTTDGQIVEYPTPSGVLGQPQGIVVGPDGAIWFVEQNSGKVGRLDGIATEFTIPNTSGGARGPFPFDIVAGPDGHLWFSEQFGERIGRITTGSEVTVDYSFAPNGITVNLSTGMTNTGQNGFGGTDTLTDVQAVIGSLAGNNTFIGGAEDDTFVGQGPDNHFDGGAGRDLLTGGAAEDVFAFDAAALADAPSAIFDRVTNYKFAEGDKLDLSALPVLSAAYNQGSGQPVDALVRLVADASGTFARLQIDNDGAAKGVKFVTIARLDGVQAGDQVNVILDAGMPAAPVTVDASPPSNEFNADGTSDILWRSDSGTSIISFVNNGQIQSGLVLPARPSEWHVAGTGDFDGDGGTDILWRNVNGDNAIDFVAGGQFQSTASLPAKTTDWHVVGAGDFNGDGTSDILWRNDNGANRISFLNNGQVQSESALPGAQSEWQVVGVGDFNGDGTSDILWRNDNGSNLISLLNNGQVQSGSMLPATQSEWHVGGIGDFNGDGTSDILWRNDNGANRISFINNGQAQSGATLPSAQSDWHIVAISDFNADGTSDILWHNDSGTNRISFIDNGQVQSGASLPSTMGEWHVVGHFYELL